MKKKNIKILLALPDPQLEQQTQDYLKRVSLFNCKITTLATEKLAKQEIAKNHHDLYLLGFQSLVEYGLETKINPIIFLTDNQDLGYAFLEKGIADYLELKDLNSSCLERSLRLIIAHSQTQKKYQKSQRANLGLNQLLEFSLQEANQTLQNLIKNIPVGFAIIDAQCRFSYLNSFLAELLGYSETEILNTSILNYLDPEGQKIIEDQYQQCNGHCQENFICQEINFYNRQGEQVYTVFSASNILDNHQNCHGLLVVITDISKTKKDELKTVNLNQDLEQELASKNLELKQKNRELSRKISQLQKVQKKLQETKNRLKYLVQNAPLIVYIVNKDGRIVFVQGKVLETINLDAKQILGQSIFDLSLINYDFWGKFQETFAGKEFTWRSQYGDRYFENCTTPLRNDHNEIIGLIGVALDISENYHIEQALIESETRFRQLAENIESVFWLFDAKTQELLYVSPAYEKVWGSSCEYLYNNPQSWLDMVHPDDHNKLIEHLEQELLGNYDPIEYRIIKPDGSLRWIQSRTFPIFNQQGEIDRIAGIADDITSRKQIQQALIKEKNDLKEAQKVAHVGSWEFDCSTENLTWSEETFRIFGLEPSQNAPTKEERRQLIYHEDIPIWEEIYPQNLFSKQPYQVELRIVRPDGSIRDIFAKGQPIVDENDQLIRVFGTVLDITERKAIENALRQSEERLLLAQKIAHLGYWVWEIETGALDWSEEIYHIFGLQDQEFNPSYERFLSCVHPEDRDLVIKAINQALAENILYSIDHRIILPNGEIRFVHEQANIIYNIEGKPIRMVGTVQDITELKKITLELQESETRFRELVEHIEESFWVNPPNPTEVIYISPAYEKIWGRSCESLLADGRNWIESVHPEDRANQYLALEKMAQGERFDEEYRIIRPDGSMRWIHAKSTPIYDENGQILRHVGICHDITERKQAEIALRESEARFHSIFNQAAIGIAQIKITGEFSLVNQKFVDIVGYSMEELLTMTWQDITYAPDVAICVPQFQKMLAGEIDKLTIEKRYVHKDGQIIWIQATASFMNNADQQPDYILGIVEDITEQKQAEIKLRESEQRYLTLVESLPVGIYRTDNQGKSLYINRKTEEMAGITRLEATGDGWAKSIHPEDRQRVWKEWNEAVSNGKIFNLEHRFLRPDGLVTWVIGYAVPERDINGNIISYVGSITDITERKQTEAKLRESEQKLKQNQAQLQAILDYSPALIYIKNLQGDIILANRQFAVLDLPPLEEFLGKNVFELFPQEIAEKLWHNDLEVLEARKPLQFEEPAVHKDGTIHTYLTTKFPVFTEAESPFGICGISTDITQEKQIRQALSDSENRFRGVFEQAAVGIALFTASGQFLQVNQKYCDLTGYSEAELLEKNFAEITYPEDVQFCVDNIQQMVKGNLQTYSLEKRFLKPSGKLQWVNATISSIHDEPGNIEYFVGIVEDIQDRKEAEAALKASEKELRVITDALPVCISYVDKDQRYRFANKTYQHWLGHDLENIYGKTVIEVIGEEAYGLVKDSIEQVFAGETVNLETKFPYPDGSCRYLLGNLIPDLKDQQVEGYYVVLSDISDRKEYELQLQESEQQFRAAFEQAAVGMAQADSHGNFLKVNQKFCDLLGYTEAELLQLNFAAITYPDDLEKSSEYIRESLAGNLDYFTIEKRYVQKNGEPIWAKLFCTLMRHQDGTPKYYMGVIEDITQRKKAEETIKASEQQLRLITNALPVCISYIDSEQRYRFVNKTYKDWFGYQPESIYGKTLLEVIGETAYLKVKNNVEKALSGEIVNYEAELSYLNGGSRYVMGNLIPDLIDNQVKGYYALITDITDRKQFELKLQESEERYRHLVENVPAIIYSFSVKKGGIFYSSHVESILGYSKQYLLDHPNLWYQSIHPEDRHQVDQIIENFLDKTNFQIEYRILDSQGNWHWFSDLCFNYIVDQDDIIIEGLALDITTQKQAQEELIKNQQFIQTIIDASPSLIHIYDVIEQRNVYMNGDYKNILGFTPEEIYAMENQLIHNLIHPEEIAINEERLRKFAIAKDGEIIETEYRCRNKNGQWRWLYSRDLVLNRTEDGKPKQILGATLDITQRKEIELELLKSKQFIEQITDTSPQLLYIFDLITHENIYINRQISEMLGYTVEEIRQKGSQFFLEIWHPDDLSKIREHLTEWENITNGDVKELEFRVKHADGSWRWLQSRDILFSRTSDGRPKEILGTGVDITNKKQAEEALKASEIRFRSLFQTTANIIVVLSPDHKILEWNEEAEKVYGYTKEEILGKDYFLLFLPPEERELVAQDMRKVLTGIPTRNIENNIIIRDGSIRHVIWNTNPFIGLEGQLLGIIACGQDITERKLSEIALKESEERFRAIFEQAAVGIAIFNPLGQYLRVNQKYCNLVGYNYEELLNKTVVDLTYSEDRFASGENFRKLLSGEIKQAFMEKRFVTASGEVRWANATVSLVHDHTNNSQYFIGILEDINDRKQAEEKLRFQSQLLDNVRESVIATDLDGKIIYWGKGAENLYKYPAEQVMGQQITLIVNPQEETEELARMNAVLEQEYWRGEYQQICRDGSSFWSDTLISLMKDPHNQPMGFIGIDRDVTNRKIMEERLQYRLKIETALAQISQLLATEETVDFSEILGMVGQVIGVNYVELGLFQEDLGLMSSVWEWCDQQTPSLLDRFQNIEINQINWWFKKLLNNQNIMINSLEELPEEAQNTKAFLAQFQVTSVLEVPVFDHRGKLWGGISLNTQRNNYKHWLEEDAQLVRVVGEMIYNYYQRRETQEQLQASEALYSGVFNHSADAIFLVKVLPDHQFVYETVNPAYLIATKLELEKLIDQTPQEIFSESMANFLQETYQTCVENETTLLYEENLNLKSGKRIWRTNLVPIKDSNGRVVKLQGNSRDITQEKEAEEAQLRYLQHQKLLASLTLKIRQSWQIEEILETVVKEIYTTLNPDRVVCFQFSNDCSGIVVNEAAREGVIKMLNQVIVDRCYQEKSQERYQEGYIQACANVNEANLEPCYKEFLQQYQIQANLVLPIVVTPLEKDKEFLGLSDTIPTLKEAKVWGLLCVQQCDQPRQWTREEIQLLGQLTDQLGIALYQAELLKQQTAQRRELARSNQELEQFAYIASHDLQEPLNTVSGYAQLLERRYKGKLDEKADRFLGYMINGVKRMQTQINDLLQYSRVNRKNNPFEAVDCNGIYQKAIANLQLSIHQNQASVQKLTDLPTVMADPAQMLQLLQNLISNGIKYHGQESPIIEVEAQLKDNFWEFSIKDNGIGIDPQYHQRIFQIFQRLHTQDEYPGTGIGLAICQRIVERHGGKIWLDSNLNQGSTFYFTIPVP